jgi:hypothetical protein
MDSLNDSEECFDVTCSLMGTSITYRGLKWIVTNSSPPGPSPMKERGAESRIRNKVQRSDL